MRYFLAKKNIKHWTLEKLENMMKKKFIFEEKTFSFFKIVSLPNWEGAKYAGGSRSSCCFGPPVLRQKAIFNKNWLWVQVYDSYFRKTSLTYKVDIATALFLNSVAVGINWWSSWVMFSPSYLAVVLQTELGWLRVCKVGDTFLQPVPFHSVCSDLIDTNWCPALGNAGLLSIHWYQTNEGNRLLGHRKFRSIIKRVLFKKWLTSFGVVTGLSGINLMLKRSVPFPNMVHNRRANWSISKSNKKLFCNFWIDGLFISA